MKKLFLLAVLSALFVSCTSSDIKKEENNPGMISQNEALELIDVRIYEDGKIRINGSDLSESALESHIDALAIDGQSTKVRITSSDKVFTGLVHRTLREFAERNISNVNYKMMSASEFEEFEKDLIIDVLSSGRIMLDGNLLHPGDLAIAIANKPSTEKLEARLYVADMAKMGTVTDIQKTLNKKKVNRITYSTIQS